MARRSSESQLSTTIAVLEALGGVRVVAALTGADWKNVDTWQRSDTFPSKYFWVMWFALWCKGLFAPPELWGQVTPAQRKQALAAIVTMAKKEKAAA